MKIVTGMKAVVLGCGTAGISAVRFLISRGATVGVSDVGDASILEIGARAELESRGVVFEFGGHTEEFVASADLVVPSPGIPLDVPILDFVRSKGIPLVGELGLAAGMFDVPVIGVTGSNGKTTVTALLGELLHQRYAEVFVGGNIGNPLLHFFLDGKKYQAAVLELSSFQLELTGEFRPDVSLILNVTADHLDRHHTLDGYLKAKLNLVKNQQRGDVVILGKDDPILERLDLMGDFKVCGFGTGNGCEAVIEGDCVRLRSASDTADLLFPLARTAMHSSVNRLNAAAAILAASLIGCTREQIIRGLDGFTPPLHRMTDVAIIGGVRYINDSKATNVGALQAALAGCEQPVVLIAGGRDKQGDFHPLKKTVAARVRHLVLMGEAAEKMKEVFNGIVPVTVTASMKEAVSVAASKAIPGDIVLLAPGCASFDMFSGYAQRGQVYTETVRGMIEDTEQ